MAREADNPLFTMHTEFAAPPIEPVEILSNRDVIDSFIEAATDRATPNFDKDTGLFCFDGTFWRLKDTYYITREINTDHKFAFGWLKDRGYDKDGPQMVWVMEVIFDSGRQMTTSHRAHPSEAKTYFIAGCRFAVYDTAIINLSRVVYINSFRANADLLQKEQEKKFGRGTRNE